MTSTRLILTAAALLAASTGQAPAAGPADAPPGAAACSGCHPATKSVDASVSRLSGREPTAIVEAMAGFKSGQLPGTVMGRIAKGFSDDEIKAIAAWYGAQKD
jgi:sulfide dehydrogenase cytochrome subunit